MNEQVYNENVEAMENFEVDTEMDYVESETTGRGGLGIIALGLGLVGAATAAVLYKTKDLREKNQIKRLEKKGYVVYKEDYIIDESDEANVAEETEEI